MVDFKVHVLRSEPGDSRLSVTIPEENAPLRINDDGEEERDHGNADWPTDKQVASVASKLLGRKVLVKFFDAGDNLLEGIYDVIES